MVIESLESVVKLFSKIKSFENPPSVFILKRWSHVILIWSDISFGSIVHNIRTMIKYSLILHKRHQFRNRFYSTKAQKVVDNSTIWRRFVTDEWVGDCLNYLLGVITSRRWRSAYMVRTTT